MSEKLTPAELRALEAYALQTDQRAAAAVCGIDYQTLKNELTAAYRKLGVNNAIAAFRALGWLVPR